jgi:signal transduction histidine kinase
MPDGGFQYIFWDITQHLKEQEALALSQWQLQQYADIVTNIQIGLYVFSIDDIHDDRTLRLIEANPTALRISGKQYKDVIGKPIDEIFETLREKQFPEKYAEVIRTGISANLLDSYYEVPDGRLTGAYDVKVFPLPHQCVAVAFEDITARTQVEMEREKLVEELRAKNQELERFTYTVSHDLKSPLVTIKGFLGFLENDAQNGRLDRMVGDINRIQDAALKMEELLNDLLALSRIGRLTNPLKPVAFAELVEEALKLVTIQLQKREVQVIVQPDLPIVYGDQPRLVEVMQNLVDNAIKFMGEQPQPQIEIGVSYIGDEAVFFVYDNGIGIEPAYHHKIFNLFDRLDQQIEGTGIGLTLVQRIVEVHGGRVWVESKGKGQGSMFCFVLPLANKYSIGQ